MKKPRPKAGAVPPRSTRTTTEDLMKELRDTGAKVRMRVVVEMDVDEDNYDRESFNEHVIETVRVLENDNYEIVFLTTEELVKS